MPDRSMNVINLTVIEELRAIRREGRRRRRHQGRRDHICERHVLRRRRPRLCWNRSRALLPGWRKNQGEEAGRPRFCSRKAANSRCSIATSRNCGKPWVAAINGTALGGGFELVPCLPSPRRRRQFRRPGSACPKSRSACSRAPAERKRIARMMQPADALQLLLKGDQLRLSRAKGMKLIDNVVPAADLVTTAKNWIKSGGKPVAPWDVQGFKLPGGLVYLQGRDDGVSRRRMRSTGARPTTIIRPRAPSCRSSTKACSFRSISPCAWSRASLRKSCARRKPPP